MMVMLLSYLTTEDHKAYLLPYYNASQMTQAPNIGSKLNFFLNTIYTVTIFQLLNIVRTNFKVFDGGSNLCSLRQIFIFVVHIS